MQVRCIHVARIAEFFSGNSTSGPVSSHSLHRTFVKAFQAPHPELCLTIPPQPSQGNRRHWNRKRRPNEGHLSSNGVESDRQEQPNRERKNTRGLRLGQAELGDTCLQL